MKKKILISIMMLTVSFFVFSTTCSAATWSKHALTRVFNTNYYARGVRGDFLLPLLDAKRSLAFPNNFITFEQWIPVNGNSGDWLEIGYTNGYFDHLKQGGSTYTGFFKAKYYQETYWEVKLDKTATVGTRYKFTIVDSNHDGNWDIFIDSTYFGKFDGIIPRSNCLWVDQGYEFNIAPGSPTPIYAAKDITNQQYYFKDGSTTWRNFNSVTGIDTYNTATSYLLVVWNSSLNKTTFY